MTTTTKTKKTAKKAAPVEKAEIRLRIDVKTKAKAEKVFKRHGLSTSDGIRTLIRQVAKNKAMPYDPDAPHTPNAKTQKVIEDARAGKNMTPVTIEELRKRWE